MDRDVPTTSAPASRNVRVTKAPSPPFAPVIRTTRSFMAISKPQHRINSLWRLEPWAGQKFHSMSEVEEPTVREVLAVSGMEITWPESAASQGGPATYFIEISCVVHST